MSYFLTGNERSDSEWVQLYKIPFDTLHAALKHALDAFHLRDWKESKGTFTIKTYDRIYTIKKENPS